MGIAPNDPSIEAINARLGVIEAQLHAQHVLLQEIRKSAGEARQLVGPCGIPVSPDELLVQTLFGVKFYVPASDQLMTPQLVVYRQWEPHLSQLMLRFAPPGSVFVDVGANLGYFTCLVAAKMGQTPGSRVIAIEPNPKMLRLLEINMRINWSMAPVRVVPVAVAEEPGTCLLNVPEYASGNASLAVGMDRGRPESTRAVEVEIRRLDDVLRDEPRVDLLKVDVEGFEAAVFRGAAETLQRPGLKIVFEWAQKQIRSAGFDPQEVLSALRQHGYHFFDAETYLHSTEAVEMTEGDIMAVPYGNLLALRLE